LKVENEPAEKVRRERAGLNRPGTVRLGFSNRGSHVVVYEPEEVYDKALIDEQSVVYAEHF